MEQIDGIRVHSEKCKGFREWQIDPRHQEEEDGHGGHKEEGKRIEDVQPLVPQIRSAQEQEQHEEHYGDHEEIPLLDDSVTPETFHGGGDRQAAREQQDVRQEKTPVDEFVVIEDGDDPREIMVVGEIGRTEEDQVDRHKSGENRDHENSKAESPEHEIEEQ